MKTNSFRASSPRDQKLSLRTREAITGLLLVAPALIVFFIFVYRPLAQTISLSFYEWNMVSPNRTYVGWGNYRELLKSSAIRKAFANTVSYAFWLIGLIIILPIAVSIGLTNVQKRARQFYRVILFSPTVVSLGIASVMWLWIYNPIGGLLGTLWEKMGLEPVNWLSAPHTALGAIVVIVAWKSFGYNMLLLLAGIGGISNETIDAARVDGADGIKLWSYIVLPLISPTIWFVLVSTLSMSAEYVFTPIHVITGGGPINATTNIVFEIWRQAFRWFKVGYSSAIATVVFIVFAALMVIQLVVSERVVSYEER